MTTLSKATEQSLEILAAEVTEMKEVSFDHPYAAEVFFQYWRDYVRLPLLSTFENGKTFFRIPTNPQEI